MRTTVWGSIAYGCLICLAGCDGMNSGPSKRMPVTPPGIAPIGQDLSDLAKPAAPAQPPAAAAPAQPAPPPDNRGIIGKTTAKVVDAKAAKQNPNIKVVDAAPSGADPLSFALGAYISIRSKASTLGFQGAINQFKGVEGRNPTYAEFMQMAKENRMEFTEIEPFRMYGYDQDTGGIVILEDADEKARVYKAAGLNPDGT
jgi:hypothetical protein